MELWETSVRTNLIMLLKLLTLSVCIVPNMMLFLVLLCGLKLNNERDKVVEIATKVAELRERFVRCWTSIT